MLCLWPPMKLLTNNLLNSWNEVMVFGGSFSNHTLAGPFKMVRKAPYMILSRTPWRCMVILNVAIWSQGYHVPSHESKVGILNLEGRGWLVMDMVKGESVLWTNHPRGLLSSWSPSSPPWFSSFGPFLSPSVVPCEWQYLWIGLLLWHHFSPLHFLNFALTPCHVAVSVVCWLL